MKTRNCHSLRGNGNFLYGFLALFKLCADALVLFLVEDIVLLVQEVGELEQIKVIILFVK